MRVEIFPEAGRVLVEGADRLLHGGTDDRAEVPGDLLDARTRKRGALQESLCLGLQQDRAHGVVSVGGLVKPAAFRMRTALRRSAAHSPHT